MAQLATLVSAILACIQVTSVTTASRLLPARAGPWPDQPRRATRDDGCTGPGTEHVFPSGRAAILACLKLAGIGASSVVATPECVSSCVADAVRTCARPAPFRAALATEARELGAAIVYEQWGWPLPPAAQDAVSERFARVPIIVDRVDSADFFLVQRDFGNFEVLSLSKVLGIDAGGIARTRPDGAYVRFEPAPSPRSAPVADHPNLLAHPAVRELFKQSGYVHPSVLLWLTDNCALSALEAERRARSAAAMCILESERIARWPTWMAESIESGAGPVWAPVLRGSAPSVYRQAIVTLARSWGVHAAVRTFNWTGNPLLPDFEAALALPIHGGVQCRDEIVAALTRFAS